MHDMFGLIGRVDHEHNALSADDVMFPNQHEHLAAVVSIERVVLHDRPHTGSPLAPVPREVPRVPLPTLADNLKKNINLRQPKVTLKIGPG